MNIFVPQYCNNLKIKQMAKLKNIYYGKVEVTNVDKKVLVKGINFERDPSADEAEEYKGNAWMRQ